METDRERFKNKVHFHLKKLTNSSHGADNLIKLLEKKVGDYVRYNSAALACASYFNNDKSEDAMNKCIEYLASTHEMQIDSNEKREGLKMDVLRYLRIFQ